MNAKDIIKAYDALVGRALKIVQLNPCAYVQNGEFARLAMDGDSAFLRWPELGAYDAIDENDEKFPEELLIMTNEEFDAWVAQKEEERRLQYAKQKETERRLAEQKEREQLAKLKAKYEGA